MSFDSDIRSEPIVRSPGEPFRCFMGTDLDALAVDHLYLVKDEQNPALRRDYRNSFELD